jgi:IclR family pca regulon transcriptional regulator
MAASTRIDRRESRPRGNRLAASSFSRASRSPETFVESFEKGLRVIAAFDAHHASMTLSEVAEHAKLTRAAARRLLLTLVELGFAQQDDRQFNLTPRVLQLGQAYLRSSALPDLAMQFLERVSKELGESSSLAVLDETEIVYVARNQTKRIMTTDLAIGARLPAASTSMGRVLLAFDPRGDQMLARATLKKHTERTIVAKNKLRSLLSEVRSRGYALVDQELEEGLRSIAVPVTNRSGRVVAAMNVSGQANRVTLDHMKRSFLPTLLRAAADLGALLH